MKSTEELTKNFADEFATNRSARGFKMFKMISSGDPFKDFFDFTEMQGGGLSRDVNDFYITNGGHWPPKRHIDGCPYHTSRDITWDTFKFYFPHATAEDFYTMTDEKRSVIVRNFIRGGLLTSSDSVNYLLGYCIWGTGNCRGELKLYWDWYKTNIRTDIATLGENTVFMRLIDIRKFRLSKSNMPGHVGGILCFWNVFKNYAK